MDLFETNEIYVKYVKKSVAKKNVGRLFLLNALIALLTSIFF